MQELIFKEKWSNQQQIIITVISFNRAIIFIYAGKSLA